MQDKIQWEQWFLLQNKYFRLRLFACVTANERQSNQSGKWNDTEKWNQTTKKWGRKDKQNTNTKQMVCNTKEMYFSPYDWCNSKIYQFCYACHQGENLENDSNLFTVITIETYL